jgi:hypothetical protein
MPRKGNHISKIDGKVGDRDNRTMYPPEPWHLRGRMYLSVFGVPRATLPPLPAGVRPVTVAGRAIVGAAWVRYEPGGTLSYRELLSAVLVRGRGLGVTIVDIWVDDVRSRDGGRELWGIPKELARISMERDGAVGAAGAPIAEARIRARRWPGTWPFAFTVIQEYGGGLRRSPVRGRAAAGAAVARWQVEPEGPLGYLAGRKPVWSVALHDFRLRFGRRR